MENRLRKYFQVLKISWEDIFVYRLNFTVWRIRNFLLLMGHYFIWFAVYRFNNQIGSYNEKEMLTYVIGGFFLGTMVFSSRSARAADDISSGGLNVSLLRPLGYFGWLFSQDLAEKAANLFLVGLELIIFFVLLKPAFFVQTSPLQLIAFLTASAVGLIINFYLTLMISLISFWHPEHGGWPARFLFMVVTQFLCGGVFPLDILPKSLYNFFRLLPVTYLRFFPLQIYLGRTSFREMVFIFSSMIFWLFLLRFLVRLIWQKGLKNYTGVGI